MVNKNRNVDGWVVIKCSLEPRHGMNTCVVTNKTTNRRCQLALHTESSSLLRPAILSYSIYLFRNRDLIKLYLLTINKQGEQPLPNPLHNKLPTASSSPAVSRTLQWGLPQFLVGFGAADPSLCCSITCAKQGLSQNMDLNS